MENFFDGIQKLVLERMRWYQQDTLPNEDWLHTLYGSEPQPSRYETVNTYLLLQILSQLSQQQAGMSLSELRFSLEVLENCTPTQAAKEMISKRLAEKGWEYRWDDANEQYGLFLLPGESFSSEEMERIIEGVAKDYDLSDPRWNDQQEEKSHA